MLIPSEQNTNTPNCQGFAAAATNSVFVCQKEEE
jgi:hypothetical protein